MMIKKVSWLGCLFTAGYAGSIFLFRYYSWHCGGQNCMYALVVPFLPWAVWLEPWIHHGNAVPVYAGVAAVNGAIAYGCGWGLQKVLAAAWRRLWKKGPMTRLLSCVMMLLCAAAGAPAALAGGGVFRPVSELLTVDARADAADKELPASCSTRQPGVRLACHPEWQARMRGNDITLRISTEPRIDLDLSYRPHQQRTGIRFGWAELSGLKRYQGWFDMAPRHECGRKIVQAKGYLDSDPRARAFDYYLADWEGLYAAQFTVARAVEFAQVRALIEEIIDSVEFVTENSETVNFRAPNDRQCQTITRE